MMKPFKLFMLLPLALFLAAIPASLQADEVEVNRVSISFRFTNLDKFPDYRFYFHPNHDDEMSTADTVWVKEGEEYYAGLRGLFSRDPVVLRAVNKKGGPDLTGPNEIGGAAYLERFDISILIQEWEIVSVENGEINAKIKNTWSKKTRDSKEKAYKENVTGGWNMGPEIFGTPLLMLVLPLISLLLILWIIFRRINSRKPRLA